MRSRFFGGLALAAVLVSGLVLVSCGDDDDTDTSTTATALSKAEFLQQGNAICAKGNKAVDQLANQTFEANQEPTDAQIEQFAKQAAPLIQQQIDGIRALGAPAGDEAQVNAILDDAQAALDKLEQDPLAKGDPFTKANQEAKAYGLTACAG